MNEREYESFKEFIHTVLYETMDLDDYEFVLTELDFPIRSKRKSNYWLLASSCHNVDSRLAKSNLQFWLDSRSFKCYSECGCSYNLLTLVEKRFKTIGEPKTRIQSMKWICELLKIPFEFKDDRKPKNDIFNWQAQLKPYVKEIQTELEYEVYDKKILRYFEHKHHESWLEYGISAETMDKYKIRWYPYRQQIVIPCINKDGDMIGIRIRNMNPNIPVKYMPLQLLDGTEYGFPTRGFMYGENFNSDEIRRTKEAWIVEAEKSVLKSDTWFREESKTLGLYSHELQKEKITYLVSLGVEALYIMIDSDFYYTDEYVYVLTDGENYITEKELSNNPINAIDFLTEEEALFYPHEDSFHVEKVKNKKIEIFVDRVMKIYDNTKPYFKYIYVVYNNVGYKNAYKFSPFDFTREQFDVLKENKEELT